jgi:hypothetical protein
MNNVLPATDYRNPNVAKAAPLRGNFTVFFFFCFESCHRITMSCPFSASVGYSLWGANIYGPMEAGYG